MSASGCFTLNLEIVRPTGVLMLHVWTVSVRALTVDCSCNCSHDVSLTASKETGFQRSGVIHIQWMKAYHIMRHRIFS